MIAQESLPSLKTVLSTAASVTATAVLIRSIADLIPDSIHQNCASFFQTLSNRLSPYLTVVIEEFDALTPNQMFEAATVYLGTKLSPSTCRFKVSKHHKENELSASVDKNQDMIDFFKGVKFKWVLVCNRVEQSVSSNKKSGHNQQSEHRFFELTCRKKYRDLVMTSYLPFILHRSKAIREEKKDVKLHTIDYNGTDYWSWINLDHPATFDTIAMDSEMKAELIEDLDRFVKSKDFYRRVGRAWKRGYLLYGPPGTGKSSLVAAMANYLKFDVYDLDLKEVQCNSDLRRLLIGTDNRSILVIEDIDCSFEFKNRNSEAAAAVDDEKVTLSGLLNFIDGLCSCCGDERIVVFTTNHKDRLDPALLRPGRMDMHIHMSYCTFTGFKILASNYLAIKEHKLFGEVEELLKEAQATPAEVAGELMKRNDVEKALHGLIIFLQNKSKWQTVMPYESGGTSKDVYKG